MATEPDLDRVRKGALERIDRTERKYKLAFIAAAAVEAAFLGGFLLLADLKNRTHVLLLISTVAIYTIVCIGLVGLGAFVARETRLVLKALDARE